MMAASCIYHGEYPSNTCCQRCQTIHEDVVAVLDTFGMPATVDDAVDMAAQHDRLSPIARRVTAAKRAGVRFVVVA